MAEQYWVGDFFIDLSRNQITENKQSQTMAPKALAVLTYLAQNQGKVVSHDALLSQVWPGIIVSPNTLQRSIAQLRKALGDDGKVQVYIKTHAKKGYSLECDVRWQDSALPHSPQLKETKETNNETAIKKQQQSRDGLRWFSFAAAIIALCFVGYKYFVNGHSSQLTFDTLRSLTATDDKEFDATYTPDGQYIVFHRYLDKQCVNKLWAKNIRTQKEIQLTKDWGAYGSHSFSKDGKQLVFLATEPCHQPITQSSCYDLVNLDFEMALISPQQPRVMLQCKNSLVKKPKWLNNDNIALLQKQTDRWKLISYSTTENASSDLYDLQTGNLIDYAYSAQEDLIAVTSIHEDDQQYIDMLRPDGEIISSHQIELTPEIPEFRLISPSFDSLNQQLVFSTGRQLFSLSYDGKVSKLNLPSAQKMMQPEFHPDGNKLLLIKGPYDSDIVLFPLNQLSGNNPLSPSEKNQFSQSLALTSFERTNLGEDNAVFQPGGQLIAFWSERSGEEQLWISEGLGAKQLTQFPTDSTIRGIDWASDGQSLLLNANNVLTQVFLDSKQKNFPFEYPVVKLYQWDSENNTALLLVRIKGRLKLAELDLNSSKMTEITDRTVLWALKSEDGRLIYKDHLGQFWQPGQAEDQLIEALGKQPGKAKSFVIKGNTIFAINKENQLWSYDLDHTAFEVLGEVSESVDHLTDINGSQLLLTIQVSAKKEVVELSLSP